MMRYRCMNGRDVFCMICHGRSFYTARVEPDASTREPIAVLACETCHPRPKDMRMNPTFPSSDTAMSVDAMPIIG
jgi:hypothetical protein